MTPLFCPFTAIPPSSTGSSSHAAAVGPTARVFALHFEASKSRHCSREAAVFGFWEEPARVLLYCAIKMSSSSDSYFAIKRSWSNSAGSKTLHALREGGGPESGLQIGSHGVRVQVASIGDPLP